jgi:hypothetical protein
MKHRWRWGLYGLLLGGAYVLADMLLEWRGRRYLPWSGTNAIAENIGRIIGGLLIFVVVAFLLGYLKDRRVARKAASAPNIPPPQAEAAVADWYIFADDVEYGPLSTASVVAYVELHGLSGVHVWRQGMGEWKAPDDVPELVLALREGPDAKPGERRRNWIARHWRGDLPLWVSYWVISFVVNLAVPVIGIAAGALFGTDTYQPLRSFATVSVIWLAALVVVTWQFVGLWRSARHYRAERMREGKWGVWGIAAQVAVVIGVIANAGTFVKDGVPQLGEVYDIAFRGDPDLPDYSIRVMRSGTEAEIVGGFKYGLTNDFSKVLAASRQIGVVHLDSYGGRIGEGEALHDLIKQRGLVTYVSAKCMSACTLAFAAGRERYIARGATLGFHKGAFPGMKDGGQDDTQREIFTRAGFDRTFVDTALSTPHKSMYKPSADVLLQARVITGVANNGQFAFSGMGGEVSKDTVAAGLASIPTFSAIRDRHPERFAALVEAYYASIVAGKTEAETLAALRPEIAAFINNQIPAADDDVVMEAHAVLLDQLKTLRAKNPAWCYQYARGTGASFHHEMPRALQQRESSMQERAIRTAAKRAPIAKDAAEPLVARVFSRLTDNGATDEDLALLEKDGVEAARQPRYCDLNISFYEELMKLPNGEALIAMRFLLESK